MSDEDKTKKEAEATKELTEAERKRKEQYEEFQKYKEEQDEKERIRMDRMRLLTALQGDAAANAGNLRDAYDKLNEATKGYNESLELLSAEQGVLEKLQADLLTANEEEAEQIKERIKLAETQIANREQEVEQFKKITKSLREQTDQSYSPL